MRKHAICLTILISSLLVSVEASGWPQFQGDAMNSGLTGDEVPNNPQIIWSADLVRVDVPPIVADGFVYVLAGNGTLWSLSKRTGYLRWKAQMDGWVFQTSTPAFWDGRIFAATDSGDLAAFDADTTDAVDLAALARSMAGASIRLFGVPLPGTR